MLSIPQSEAANKSPLLDLILNCPLLFCLVSFKALQHLVDFFLTQAQPSLLTPAISKHKLDDYSFFFSETRSCIFGDNISSDVTGLLR